MPCDSLTVQTVAVAEEALVRLVTPELALAAVKAALADLGVAIYGGSEAPTRDGAVLIYAGTYGNLTIKVRGGRVAVSSDRGQRAEAERVRDGVLGLLKQLGAQLIGTEVLRALVEVSGQQPEVEEGQAEQEGRIFPVLQLTVNW